MLKIRLNHEHAWSCKTESLSDKAIQELAGADQNIAAAFWADYLKDALPSNHRSLSLHLGALLPLEDITELKAHAGEELDLNVVNHFFQKRILRIDPSAPDNVLKRAFDKWLQQWRKLNPLSVRRPGRRATNVEITHEHLKSWTTYNVLAVIDLDFCATVFDVPPLSHEHICDLLLAPERIGDVGPKDWGREARSKANEAKKSLELLIAQARAERNLPDNNSGGPN